MSHRTPHDEQLLLGSGSQRSYFSLSSSSNQSGLARINELNVLPSPPAVDSLEALSPPGRIFQRTPLNCWQRLLEWAPDDPRGQVLWQWLQTLLQQEQTGLSHWVWQLSLSGALLHDWIEYERAPHARFGNTLGHLLSGWMSDPNAVGTHWGSDRPSERLFWAAPAALLLLAGISMVRTCGLERRWCSSTDESLEYRRALDQFEQTVSSVLPYVQNADLVADGAYWLAPRCSTEDRQRILDQVAITSKEGSFGLRHRAMGQLIVFLRHQLIEGAATPEVANIQATNWVHQISMHVQFHRQSRRVTHRGWVRYQLWRQGLMIAGDPLSYRTRTLRGVALGLIFLWRQFVRYHYWRLLITKLWQAIAMIQQQQACEASHRQWFYVPLLDQDVCAICPDWLFVPLASMDDPQACLNGLFQQLLPPMELARRLARLRFHPNVSQLDLSHQPWAYGWQVEELSAVLDALELIWLQPQASPLQRLELSNTLGDSGVIELSRLQRLARFMDKLGPLDVRLRHYAWGAPAWEVLTPVWVNGTETLDVSFSDWGDAGLRHWLSGDFLPVCQRLHAEHSQLTDASLHALSARWVNLMLIELRLGSNDLTAEGVLAWAGPLMERPLYTLDLSDVMLSRQVTRRLWPRLIPVKQLVLHGCGLTDRALLGLETVLPRAQWMALDVSDNPFTDEAIPRLAVGLVEGRLQQLNVSYTALSFVGLGRLGHLLPQMDTLTTLDVSGCFVEAGTDDFFAGVVHSRLRHLYLNTVRLNALGLQRWVWHWQQAVNTSLQTVSLTDNEFSSTAMGDWLLRAHNSSCCERLDLAHNELNDSILAPLSNVRSLSQLRLTGNAISDLSLLAWEPNREALFVDHNRLQDEPVLSWIRSGLTPIAYFDRLGDPALTLTRAQRRDVANQRFLGALQTLDVSGAVLDTRTVTTLCRVSQVTGIDLIMTDDMVCQRSDAAMASAPWLRLLRHLPQVTLQAVGAWAGHVVHGPRPREATVGFFAAHASPSTTARFEGVSWLIGCVCLLSVWWLLRRCRRPVSPSHRPERFQMASTSSSTHTVEATSESSFLAGAKSFQGP
ncbi:MAG: hypothetical protein GKR77_00525 [Legionellales bacterium]|nr:hypothetical protein [Legionellales bacterium]